MLFHGQHDIARKQEECSPEIKVIVQSACMYTASKGTIGVPWCKDQYGSDESVDRDWNSSSA